MFRGVFYFTFLCCLLFVCNGCIKSDLEHCNTKKELRVKVIDKHGEDITSTGKSGDVLLFTFDGEDNFISKKLLPVDSIKKSILIPIHLKTGEVFKYVAWGNITDTVRMMNFEAGNKLPDNRIKPVIDDQGYAIIPADIFYGRKLVSETEAKNVEVVEVLMKRAVSQVHVTIVGMPKGINPHDYSIVITNDDQSGLNFENVVTRDNSVKYVKKPAWFQKDKMMGTEDVFTTFPSPQGTTKTIMLYKGKKVEATASEDINRQPIAPKPDERVNVLIDLNQDCPEYPNCNEPPQIRFIVSDWNEVVIWTEW